MGWRLHQIYHQHHRSYSSVTSGPQIDKSCIVSVAFMSVKLLSLHVSLYLGGELMCDSFDREYLSGISDLVGTSGWLMF